MWMEREQSTRPKKLVLKGEDLRCVDQGRRVDVERKKSNASKRKGRDELKEGDPLKLFPPHQRPIRDDDGEETKAKRVSRVSILRISLLKADGRQRRGRKEAKVELRKGWETVVTAPSSSLQPTTTTSQRQILNIAFSFIRS